MRTKRSQDRLLENLRFKKRMEGKALGGAGRGEGHGGESG